MWRTLTTVGLAAVVSMAQGFRTGVPHANYNPALPTLFPIGDSTVKNSWDTGADGLWGWGRPLDVRTSLDGKLVLMH